MRENLILVGFMGTGKSAVGKRLADALMMNFYDADKELEQLIGMNLVSFYHKYGSIRYRSEEELMLRKLLRKKNSVIATSGTLIVDEKWLHELRQSGKIICLTARPEVIQERVLRKNNRPFLRKKYMLEDIDFLIKEREKIREMADLLVDTSEKNFHEILSIILDVYKKE